MRIYGKSPSDIWHDLPLSYRIVVVAGSIFLLFSFLYLTSRALIGTVRAIQPDTGPVEIAGAGAANFLDPSMAGDGRENTALIYTGIMPPRPATGQAAATQGGLKISVATSGFPCGKWRWMLDVFSDREETLMAPDGSNMAEGRIRYETPSIVYDASDAAAPWKVFAYRYFWMGNPVFAQRYSMIVMRKAAQLNGPWSEEEWILGTAPDFPPAPYQNLIRRHINPQSPSLAGITGYARPSVVADGRALVMSLTAFRGGAQAERVIMLVSLDHGQSWVYTGTLLTTAQLPQIGAFTQLSGASLLKKNGAIYLAAVFGDTKTQGLGTFLFRVRDVGKGQLLTDKKGVPDIIEHIPLQSQAPTALGGGFAAYEDTCPQGIITSEHSGLRNSYQLFRTTIPLPND